MRLNVVLVHVALSPILILINAMHLNKTILALLIAALLLFSFMPFAVAMGKVDPDDRTANDAIGTNALHANLERHL